MYTRGLCIHWMPQQTDLSLPLNFSFISSSHAIASGIWRSKKRTFTYNELLFNVVWHGGEKGWDYTFLTYHHVSRFAVHKLQSLLQTKMH